MTTYDVIAERDGDYWLITAPAVQRWTQARHLKEVEPMARDLIAIMCDVAPDSFDLAIDVRLPEDVRRHLDEATRLREESARANAAAAVESRQAARALAETGMTVRDIGAALGVSHQRAAQLLKAA